MKTLIPLEFHECVAFAQYLDILVNQGKVQMYSHIPEMHTMSHAQRTKNTMQGFHSGMPDYMILLKDRILFIEMKRTKGGVVSPEQLAWIKALAGLGFEAEVAYGFDDAKKVIDNL